VRAFIRTNLGGKIANEMSVVGKATCLPPTVAPPPVGFDPLV
jgi:hypothetical protein